LRGNRETSSVPLGGMRSSCIGGKRGVFRALIAFCIDSGDTELQGHIETSGKNCTMISHKIQNEIVDVIVEKIVDQVKQFRFYFYTVP